MVEASEVPLSYEVQKWNWRVPRSYPVISDSRLSGSTLPRWFKVDVSRKLDSGAPSPQSILYFTYSLLVPVQRVKYLDSHCLPL